jgi:hypothetical protein
MKHDAQPITSSHDRAPTLTEAQRAHLRREAFRKDIEHAINRHSMENGSNTPDFILAEYLVNCLDAWERGISERNRWSAGSSREDHNA